MNILAAQLEQRTISISFERAEELLNSDAYEKTQQKPANFYSTCSILLDEEKGGIFLWSGSAQRYFLIGKRKSN